MTSDVVPVPAVAGGGGIVVAGVRRAFGDVVAVDDISLTARPGEVTALIGPNGAGKTTLMLMLATLLVPDRGTITIDGVDPVKDPREVRRRIGWMPDGFGTWDALTVREVLHTIGAAYDMPSGVARSRTEEVLAQVHLLDLADRRARVLSRGRSRRLAEGDTFGGGFTPMRWISDGSRDAKAGGGDVSEVREECILLDDAGAGPNEKASNAAKLERRNAAREASAERHPHRLNSDAIRGPRSNGHAVVA